VAVLGDEAVAVIDHDRVAEPALPAGVGDDPRIGRDDRRADAIGDVDPVVSARSIEATVAASSPALNRPSRGK
jgi:hypothetical protein